MICPGAHGGSSTLRCNFKITRLLSISFDKLLARRSWATQHLVKSGQISMTMHFIFTAELKLRRTDSPGQLSLKTVGATHMKGCNVLHAVQNSYSHIHKTPDDLRRVYNYKIRSQICKLPAVHRWNLIHAKK